MLTCNILPVTTPPQNTTDILQVVNFAGLLQFIICRLVTACRDNLLASMWITILICLQLATGAFVIVTERPLGISLQISCPN